MKRKIIGILLTAVFSITLLSGLSACSKNNDVVDKDTGIKYELVDGGYSVSYPGTCDRESLVIPATYNGITVTAIKDYGFFNCETLKEVTLPDTITQIGRSGFSNCKALEKIILPEGLKTINMNAFSGCYALTETNIPDSVTYVGSCVFFECYSLKKEQLNGIDYFDDWVLNCKTDVVRAVLQSTTRGIADLAFSGCDNIRGISYSGDISGWVGIHGLKYLMSYGQKSKYLSVGFASTVKDEVIIPTSVTSISDGAFYNCVGITSFYYNGTIGQWEAIEKGEDWDYNVEYIINCTDGVMDNNGNEIVFSLQK